MWVSLCLCGDDGIRIMGEKAFFGFKTSLSFTLQDCHPSMSEHGIPLLILTVNH